MTCDHHWTATSECPKCLRERLDAEREVRKIRLAYGRGYRAGVKGEKQRARMVWWTGFWEALSRTRRYRVTDAGSFTAALGAVFMDRCERLPDGRAPVREPVPCPECGSMQWRIIKRSIREIPGGQTLEEHREFAGADWQQDEWIPLYQQTPCSVLTHAKLFDERYDQKPERHALDICLSCGLVAT